MNELLIVAVGSFIGTFIARALMDLLGKKKS